MRKTALLAATVIVLGVCAFGQETPTQSQPAQEQNDKGTSYAHLSYVDGRIFLQRASDLGYEEVTINTPISEGDRLGTADGRTEISFGGTKFARLDNDTKIDIQTLPGDVSSKIRLRHWSGNLYLDLGSLDKEKNFELLTPKATFYFLEKGLYRIDIGADGRTEILVFKGLVETAAEDGSILVKEGQRLALTDGRFDGRPNDFFVGADDAFDRWNNDRAALVQRFYAQSRLPGDIAEYESELEAYGHWSEIDPFGFVWIPGGMAPNWRPYSWGHWTWLPMAGWCWVPYEPWGWCTYHYGRWQWNPGFGWYWIPMSGWGPAWVNWWWDDFYYGWAPMSWWGYPGIIYNNYYYGHGWDGDYPSDSRALTVVRKDQLQDPNVSRVAMRSDEIRAIGHLRLTETAPILRPDPNAPLRLEPLGDRGGVLIRKDGPAEITGNELPSGPRLIRSADRPRSADMEKETGQSPNDSSPARIIERTGKGQDVPSGSSPERRIRKTEGGESAGIIPFPSSSRISGESSGKHVSLSGLLRDKFYRVLQGDRASGSSSSKSGSVSGRSSSSSSNRSSSAGSSRSSSPSRSGSSSSSRSGSSGRSSSGSSGSVKKK
ncbi:MAG: hypothetical protein NTW38_08450 [Candidatus Aminicenantes bacterium]|nr:hypothetical protein [Candidatus Aminicenantes bacterium]